MHFEVIQKLMGGIYVRLPSLTGLRGLALLAYGYPVTNADRVRELQFMVEQ